MTLGVKALFLRRVRWNAGQARWLNDFTPLYQLARPLLGWPMLARAHALRVPLRGAERTRVATLGPRADGPSDRAPSAITRPCSPRETFAKLGRGALGLPR